MQCSFNNWQLCRVAPERQERKERERERKGKKEIETKTHKEIQNQIHVRGGWQTAGGERRVRRAMEENESVTRCVLETPEACFSVSPTSLLPSSSGGPDCIFNKPPLFSSLLLSSSLHFFFQLTSQLEQWEKEHKADSWNDRQMGTWYFDNNESVREAESRV